MVTLDRTSSTALYRQVVDQFADLIHRGILKQGARLPTVRALAIEARLTRLTVQTAYNELQALGLIESYVGKGTFVAAPSLASAVPDISTWKALPPISWRSQGVLAGLLHLTEHPNFIAFAQAVPDPATYPMREFGRALREAQADMTLFNYGPAQGDAPLREQVSRMLLERGITAPPEHVLITNGAQHAIDLIFRAVAQPGDVVLVEEPSYPGVLEVAAQLGQRVVGIARDDEGIIPAHFAAACVALRPRFLYLMPTFHNPTGYSYSQARRAAILRIAHEHNVLLVEDDVYGMLAYDDQPTPALKAADVEGRVLFLTSFSKTFMPGLRLGVIVTNEPYLTALTQAKQSNDLSSSPFMQRALALYLQRGHLGAHLHAARDHYGQRRDVMLTALARYLPECRWTHPQGGLNLWLTLPPALDEAQVVRDAIQQGIGVARGQAFFSQPQQQGYLRLCFGAQSPERIYQGIRILGATLVNHLRQRDALVARAGRESTPLV